MKKTILPLFLLLPLTSCTINVDSTIRYEKSNLYSFGAQTFEEDIENLNVGLIVSNFTLSKGETNSVSEEGEYEEILQVHHLLENKTLNIHDTGAGKITEIDTIKSINATLRNQLNNLEVDAVNTNFTCDVDVKNVMIDFVAGNINLTSSTLEKFEADFVTGNIFLYIPEGKTLKIESNTIAGQITGDYTVGNDVEININAITGNLFIQRI